MADSVVNRVEAETGRESYRARMLFSFFCAFGLVLTLIGVYFRGPGYAFVIPYIDTPGLHFNL